MTIGTVYDEAADSVISEIKHSVSRIECQLPPARESMHDGKIRGLMIIRDLLHALADEPFNRCFPPGAEP